ncbi:MAG: 50S ribosomal protein L5 [Candidatus Hydrogenedentes bacterium]|nr:50S ribosomal protein L5 [Candidatus Hydrogenedentota bacterium]
MPATLKTKYIETICGELKTQFDIKNVMQIPAMEKVVVNMGVGAAIGDARLMESAVAELAVITGQHPSIRKARKSISNFKLREGVNIGCMVTLRGERMYEFVDRLFNVAMPRIRDFRGVSEKAFDGQGNYTLGIKDQTIFPEVDHDKIGQTRGMNITFVVKHSNSADQSRELLRKLGMPFAKSGAAGGENRG